MLTLNRSLNLLLQGAKKRGMKAKSVRFSVWDEAGGMYVTPRSYDTDICAVTIDGVTVIGANPDGRNECLLFLGKPSSTSKIRKLWRELSEDDGQD